MDVRDHTTTGDGSFNESVQFFVSSDGKLEMTRRDALHFQILTGVPSQFQYLSREVLQDG